MKPHMQKSSEHNRAGTQLRIATMVASEYSVPQPEGIIYAPIVVAQQIMEGLVARGHDVTLFAPENSKAKVNRIVSGGFRALHGHPVFQLAGTREKEYEKIFQLGDQYLLAKLFAEAKPGVFDILHIHPVDRALPFSPFITTPMVFTLHDPIYAWRAWAFRLFQQPNHFYVSISDAQRRPAADLPYAATVYNGIDTTLFPFSDSAEDYFAFIGRLLPRKGTREAIHAAQKSGMRLQIAGGPSEGPYWEKDLAPHLNERIQYLGQLPYTKLADIYRRAKALLVPISWEEPFGLTMIEAMACGTPVIAFRRGSVPEIIVDGVTGFIVDTVEEMAEAMKKIDQIDRKKCREHVEKHFTVETMVNNYEKLFVDLAGKI